VGVPEYADHPARAVSHVFHDRGILFIACMDRIT